MSTLRGLVLVAIIGLVVAGSACTQKPADETRNGAAVTADEPNAADKAVDATKEAAAKVVDEAKEAGEKTADAAKDVGDQTKDIAEKTIDKTKEIAVKTADKTKEIAGAVGDVTKEAATTTGEAVTDAWITATVSTRFIDESLLKGSNIDVDTKDHVVTLKGTVGSSDAKSRAAAIARTTKGVRRVINHLVVT